ncbi:MAG: hypothetical protein WBN42_04790 [Ignavibacteriaceae bacterium]
MIKITDEILNKYLDDELSRDEAERVKSVLSASEELQRKFNALKLVHEKLFNLRQDEVSPGFTDTLMKQIAKKGFIIPKQQKYFIASVAAFITLLCLVIFGFSISAMISAAPPSISESKSVVDSISNLSDGLVNVLKHLFSGEGLSIIGSIFSLLIIISGYFFFEMQKRAKATLGNGQHL